EGVYWMIKNQDPCHVYHAPGLDNFKLLLRNYKLSDDIGFRFSDTSWHEHPITAQKISGWMRESTTAEVFNIFVDYETFGEHHWENTGIFNFLSQLPEEVLTKGLDFVFPSEAIDRY